MRPSRTTVAGREAFTHAARCSKSARVQGTKSLAAFMPGTPPNGHANAEIEIAIWAGLTARDGPKEIDLDRVVERDQRRVKC